MDKGLQHCFETKRWYSRLRPEKTMKIFFSELREVSQDSGFRIIPLNQSFHIGNYMLTVSQSAKIILITITEKKKEAHITSRHIFYNLLISAKEKRNIIFIAP